MPHAQLTFVRESPVYVEMVLRFQSGSESIRSGQRCCSMIEIPKSDPAVLAYDEKKAALRKLQTDRLEVSRKKERRRHEFALERQENPRGFIDDQGRDVGKAAFEEEMRRLDAREGQLLREIKKGEIELDAISPRAR
jgi:hypothetical protein